jgi:hypothetical protein
MLKLTELLTEIKNKRYTVGVFNPTNGGFIDSIGGNGLLDDFGSYSKASKFANNAYEDDSDYIYVVMDEKHVEPYPILVVGNETPKFNSWIKSLKK